MKEKLVLPIQLNGIDAATECWTFNRLAILKTGPYYEDWMVSHYNLMGAANYNLYFGELEHYTTAYHDEILLREERPCFALRQETVVEVLKQVLNTEKYPLLYFKPFAAEDDYFHEVLFFGYDDTVEEFQALVADERVYKVLTYRYSYVREVLPQVQNYLLKDADLGVRLSLEFQSPFTTFQLNKSYNPKNCAFLALKKLKTELAGKKLAVTAVGDFGKLSASKTQYTGLACLTAFSDILLAILNRSNFENCFRGAAGAAQKLLEHRLLLAKGMEYLLKKWPLAVTPQAKAAAEEYRALCETVEKWKNICLKYEFTKNEALLQRILPEIGPQLYKEQACLSRFVNSGINKALLCENYL